MNIGRALLTASLLFLGSSFVAEAAKDGPSRAVPVQMPGGEGGIGFDDLGFSPSLHKLLAPGGRTGRLFLIDPKNRGVTGISGFSSKRFYLPGHGQGTTSADEGGGFIFAADRTAGTVNAVDPAAGKIVASARLGSGPDYARYVSSTREVWVTEPDDDRIEVFAFSLAGKPSLAHTAFIPVKGGPESLVIDSIRSKAYTHLWGGATVAVDLETRVVGAAWPNGCGGSRGIALDERRGLLFAGCSEGKAVVMDVAHEGRILGSLMSGAGVDVIAYSPALSHLYLPGASSASMALIGISKEGKPSLLGTAETSPGSHCAVADDRGQVWVCDPARGRLLLIQDPFPPESR